MRYPSRLGAIVAGWIAGVVAGSIRWPHDLWPILATAAASAAVAVALGELARIWWPRR